MTAGRPPAAVVVGAAYLAGAIPFSNLAARMLKQIDLRTVGTGTVSGTSLYRVAGFGPLAVAGVLDVAKGSVGPLLAGRERPALAALAAGAGVAGHDWSPFLKGSGGRGISPALGGLLVGNWPGAVVLLTGLTAGRLASQTGLGSLVADAALVPVLRRVRGRNGQAMAVCLLLPMGAKRLMGNGPLFPLRRLRVYGARLLFDRDTWDPPAGD